ncbi:unnamed protein product [Moneuplotes crassus]|uniref:Trm112p-like protein n=1 Tax=Euplotes crassus TaxID=5936 RepID=A0AAD1XZX6_EUPCR|nr:unnamed protein product [Moneuplotes crassus]
MSGQGLCLSRSDRCRRGETLPSQDSCCDLCGREDCCRPLFPRSKDKDENLEYPALIKSLSDIEFKPDFENDPFTEEEKDLPETLPEDWQKDPDLVNKIFNTSMVKEIITGQLICRRCSREFRIVNGIINMLLKEDEIEHEE